MPEYRLEPNILRIGRSKVPGSSTQSYYSREYWALHLYFNRARLSIGPHSFHLVPGSVSLTPLDTVSCYTTDDSLDHIFVHFSSNETGPVRSLPFFVSGTPAAETIAPAVIAALSVYRGDPEWARIKLADALFAMANSDRVEIGGNAEHPALSEALTFIDFHLPEIHRLDDIADHASVSKTHVNRLFRDQLGVSAMSYVRQKRMEMARYLLRATILPVKDIAYQVGIPDIHAFNKLCKKYYGQPPTSIRNRVL